jgi:hypothetical protein
MRLTIDIPGGKTYSRADRAQPELCSHVNLDSQDDLP